MRKKFHLSLFAIVALIAGPLVAQAQGYTYETVDYPGAPNTQVFGINDRGDAVGNGFDAIASSGVAEPTGAPETQEDGNTGGSASGQANDDGNETDGADGNDSDTALADSGSGGGCSAAGTGSSQGLSALLVLLAVGATRRRRGRLS